MKLPSLPDEMKLLSLFDGIGCFPIAWSNVNNIKLKDLEYDSSEIMPFLTEIIKSNFPMSNQLFDITKLDYKDLSADIVTMGTPCTGFSISGKGDGLENIESKLFSNGVDAVDKIRPKYFIWENVFGVLSANNGIEFRSILDEFKRIGYDCVWTTLDAQYFDLPQRRRRVYLIGVRDGIDSNHNIFNFLERSSPELKEIVKVTDSFHNFDFNKSSINKEDHYAYFNRQRSDKFKEIGLSCTLAKRDYKSFMDLVVKDGSIRKITPKERLRLQGIPDYWFDCSYENHKSDIERYRANGMAIPVVEYIFEELLLIEKNEVCTFNYIDSLLKYESNERIFSKTSNDIFIQVNKKNSDKNKLKNISFSGHMILDRDKNKNVIPDSESEYLFVNSCSESGKDVKLKPIRTILLDNVDEKFHIKEGSCEGILKREIKSGNILPEKLKDVIYHKYPELKNKYKNKKITIKTK